MSRSQWGAQAPKRPLTPLDPGRVVRVFVHYVGADLGQNPDGPARMRGIQRDHLNHAEVDYSDFAYNWAVHPLSGEIYEGRGWMADGATLGWGGRSVSILVMIGDAGPNLTADGISSVAAVIAEARSRYPLATVVQGHKEAPNDTSCPGGHLLDLIHLGRFAEPGTPRDVPPPEEENQGMRTMIWRDGRDGRVYEVERDGLHKRWIASWDQVELLISQLGLSYGGDWHPLLLDSRETVGSGGGLVASLEELETNIGALMAKLGSG